MSFKSIGTNLQASSSTPLGIGASYNTGILDLDGLSNIYTLIRTDVSGTFIGTWYADLAGTQVVRTFTVPFTILNEGVFNGVQKLSNYFSLTYTNDGVAQTAFIFELYGSNVPLSAQHLLIEGFVPSNTIGQVVKAVLAGKNDSGLYQNVEINDVGALNTSSFLLDVARQRFDTYRINTKFGRNNEINNSGSRTAPADIWSGGGSYTGFPITGAATTLAISSASASDTSAGTGARTIILEGLDTDYNPISETITMNGTTTVTSIHSYWRMSRAKVVTAGSVQTNVGQISAAWTGTPAQIFMAMPADAGQTAICCDTVPAGKTRYILQLQTSLVRSSGAAGSANMQFQVRELGGAWQTKRFPAISDGSPYSPIIDASIIIPEKSDVRWRCQAVSDNASIISAEFEYIDIDN